MALFVDGPACTIADLTHQDAGLLNVAQTSGIDLTTKLKLALEEIATDLNLWLLRPRPTLDVLWGPSLRIEQAVVTPPLKRWETMHALTLVYRDAYFSQLVDRYQAKWQEFSRQARDARESFIATGLGLVSDPLRQAGIPVLTSTPGPQSGGTFYASVAWLNAQGQEGAASEASSISIPDGNLMLVAPGPPPSNAAGYRVYAGTSLDAMFQQNGIPLPLGATYTYVPGEISAGALPGHGQPPDFTRPLARTLLRG